jgi:basic membrane protein A
VKAAMNGTWKTGNYYGSLKDGFTKLAPYGPGVSAATKALIAKQKALIISGKWNEFSGPIYDQSGKVRIKPGHRPTFNDLYSMNYLVKGVIGSPKG